MFREEFNRLLFKGLLIRSRWGARNQGEMCSLWILLQFLRRLWGRRRVVCGGGWLHLSEEFGIVGYFA